MFKIDSKEVEHIGKILKITDQPGKSKLSLYKPLLSL